MTIRSTSPGKLSSSQDFSIGRSISLTRSSSVRALLLSTVLARRVEGGFRPRIRSSATVSAAAEPAAFKRRRFERGLPVHRPGRGGLGKFEIVIRFDLVERRRAAALRQRHLVGQFEHLGLRRGRTYLGLGRRLIEARQHRVDVVLAVGRGWRGGRRGRRRRRLDRRRHHLGSGGLRRGNGRGGMSFITGALAAGAAAAVFSGFAAGAGAFSAAGGLASSSAMIRRIDAKISSIEGSWTFAGCVISDSTSSTPSHAFYTTHDRICRFRICRPGFSSHKPDLSPDQAPLETSRGFRPCSGHRSVAAQGCQMRARIALLPRERYVRAIIDCKQCARMIRQSMPSPLPLARISGWRRDHARCKNLEREHRAAKTFAGPTKPLSANRTIFADRVDGRARPVAAGNW